MTGEVPFHISVPTADDVSAVDEVLASGWLTTGRVTEELEKAFSDYLDVPFAVAVSSGTAALHLMFLCSQFPPKAEIAVPVMTFASTATSIIHAGFIPRFVDVYPDTLMLNPGSIPPSTEKTLCAAIPVHFGGVAYDSVDFQHIRDLGLTIFEDAAHTLPTELGGRKPGQNGKATAFSFYATKTIPAGEGGMIVTFDEHIGEMARRLRLHGMSRGAESRYQGGTWKYDIEEFGFKYNLTDIAAALALGSLRTVEVHWQQRSRVAERYDSAFLDDCHLQIPFRRKDGINSWHLYPLRLNLDTLRIDRDSFIRELALRGVGSSVHFIPLNYFTAYQRRFELRPGMFPVAEQQFLRLISLPIWPSMTEADVNRVIESVLSICSEFSA